MRTKACDKPDAFDGVILADILAKVHLPWDKYQSTPAAHYPVVEAKAGYRTICTWADLDAGFMDKPLDDRTGPLQIVAPGEKRGGRWVRQVTALRVLRAQ